MAGEYPSAILLHKLAIGLAQRSSNSSNQKIIQTHKQKSTLKPQRRCPSFYRFEL